MSVALVFQTILAVAPLVVDLFKYIASAKKNGWIKDGEDLRKKIQVVGDKEERMDLAEYLSKHRPK